MYFNPHGIRNLPRGTKAYNRLDSVALRVHGMPVGAIHSAGFFRLPGFYGQKNST